MSISLLILNKNGIDKKLKLISLIDNKSKLNKSVSDSVLSFKIYSYKNYNKIDGNSNFMCDTSHIELYLENDSIFAFKEFIIADYLLLKGGRDKKTEIGEISEFKIIVLDDKKGVKISRKIPYFENSNKDSLMLEINKVKFDTTNIETQDLDFIKEIYNNIKLKTRA